MSPKRALVTGATSFVGGHLVPALRAGGWQVDAIVRASSPAARVAALRAADCGIHVHDGSPASMRAIVAAADPDCTWHLATKFVPTHMAEDIGPLIRSNIEFGALLLDALADAARHAAVVTTGTAWQQHDNAEYAPMSLYAATKEAFDTIAAFYSSVRGLRIVECLLFDTYGANDERRKLVWLLRNAANTGEPLKLSGDGGQYIDFLHADDVVRALMIAGDRALAASPSSSERWAVRSEQPVTVRGFVERFARALGRPVPVEWNARPPRPREMNVAWTAGSVLPGWSPRIHLDDGLKSIA